jgi:surface antigen
MKALMKKQKVKQYLLHNASKLAVLVAVLVFGLGIVAVPMVRADKFDEQINALNQDNATKKQAKDQLGAQAASLTDQINKLQAQISNLQAQISANQAKSVELQNQITAAEAELAKQKKILGENIRQMYLEGQISTLEMLASSKDLSEYIDKQQYRNAVKDKIRNTLDKITELRHQLAGQKETLDKLIKDQESMRGQLATQQAEQNRLLGLNESQQNDLNNQIKNNSAQIAELRNQQILANSRFIGGAGSGPACGGGYPARWCEIPQDTAIDNWGMYNRECVSYTAFRVAASGRFMPYWGGSGNANQWDDNARASGIPVDGSPRPGDVAISNSGYYGHAMYVEGVNGDGTINISQYNAALDGRYSTRAGLSIGGLVFIHF